MQQAGIFVWLVDGAAAVAYLVTVGAASERRGLIARAFTRAYPAMALVLTVLANALIMGG